MTFVIYKNPVFSNKKLRRLEGIMDNEKNQQIRKIDAFVWRIIDVGSVNMRFFSKLIYDKWLKMEECVENEIKIGSIHKEDKVLIIGCGAFPSTAAIISKLAESDIVAIDNKKMAVNLAEKYIKKIGLKKVSIKYGDGCNYSVKDFDVIIINSSVHPRSVVLDNILQSSQTGCRIISRELKLTKKIFTGFIVQHKKFVLEKIIDHPNNWCSCVVLKH